MNESIVVVDSPDVSDKRRTPVLTEDRIGHYSEFQDFFARTFKLSAIGLSRPGYVATSSGSLYELIFIGRSGERFPCGVEINALSDALEPIDESAVDRDLWAILRWMIAGVGSPWSVEVLDETDRLYRIPSAPAG
ncbi:MAG: hypothetical protein ABI612_18925 [Betaproteobacteria bacterium]